MTRISRGVAIALVSIVLTFAVTRASGQGAAPGGDVLSALLVEVRGLRAAMEQMASAGPRVQLAMGRLQLQEQLNTMLRRLDDVRDRVASGDAEAARMREQLKNMEEVSQTAADANDRRGAEGAVRELKMMIGQRSADLQRLRTEEAELANSVAAEQARWTDINRRLEELERALARR